MIISETDYNDMFKRNYLPLAIQNWHTEAAAGAVMASVMNILPSGPGDPKVYIEDTRSESQRNERWDLIHFWQRQVVSDSEIATAITDYLDGALTSLGEEYDLSTKKVQAIKDFCFKTENLPALRTQMIAAFTRHMGGLS